MLVLTRKERQGVVIGGDTVITVTSVRRNRVRLGIEAPEEVIANRKEVQEKMKPSGLIRWVETRVRLEGGEDHER